MKNKTTIFLAGFLALFVFLLPHISFAAWEKARLVDMKLCIFGCYTSIETLSVSIMSLLAKVIVFASVIGFMVGGGFLVFSAGDEGMMSRGKDIMIASVVGLIVTLLAYAIVQFVRIIFYSLK